MQGVLADVDASIGAWLADELPAGTEIGFEPPALLAATQRSPRRATAVNLFLHAITEDLDCLAAAPLRLRTTDGRGTTTVAPPRNYYLSYLVTAWAADVAEEHELLGAVIGAHAERDAIDAQHLRGTLRDLGGALPIRLGWSPAVARQEFWAALGLPMRTSVELTVNAPALPSRLKPLAPRVRNRELTVQDTVTRQPIVE
jgi:hypothetical protein